MSTADLGKVTGNSAYEDWIAQGHSGTIDDFLSRTSWPTMSEHVAGMAKLGRGLYITDGVLNVTGFVPHIEDEVDWGEILTMCQSHELPVGTTIVSTWKDTVNGVLYDFPWIVADNRTMLDENGVSRTGSILIAKYSLARSVQFDAGNSSVWATSDLRLWLNTNAAAGQWWTPQVSGDTQPAWAAGMASFQYELPTDMLDVVRTVKITTAGTTNDKFWIPSYSQFYCSSSSQDGSLEWFSNIAASAGYSSPTPANIPARIITKIEAKSTGDYIWTRTALYSDTVYCINSSGGGSYSYNAYNSYRVLPACFIG